VHETFIFLNPSDRFLRIVYPLAVKGLLSRTIVLCHDLASAPQDILTNITHPLARAEKHFWPYLFSILYLSEVTKQQAICTRSLGYGICQRIIHFNCHNHVHEIIKMNVQY
jgi:hypothetical protein